MKKSLYLQKIKTKNMNTAIAYIDISRPSGRRIVNEIENRRAVKMEYPMPVGKTFTVEESFSKVEKILNDFYGTNHKI